MSAKSKRTLCVRKILYLESCHMYLQKWLMCREYYWRFCNYMWWNYKGNKNCFNEKYFNKSCSNKKYFIIFLQLWNFLLITIALLTTVSICCFLIKYETKKKPLLPCYFSLNVLILFFYQWYWLTFVSKWVKTIILNSF